MIVTVTLNAAFDRTLTVPNFQSGVRNRAIDALSLAGGKGVNIARTLKRLGEPVIATGLAGGRTGTSIIEGLTSEGILNDFVRIRGESRTSTAVIDPNGAQTEIIEHGPSVAEDELEMLMEKMAYLARGADIFVLAGSLPPGVPDDFYARVIREIRGSVVTALDAQGPPLRLGLAADPDLVSPNAREAEEIVGHELNDDADLVDAAKTMSDLGARSAIVHRTDGCVARLRDPDSKTTTTFRAYLGEREAASTVGSGDALIAGYLAGLHRGDGPEARVALGVACGAANTLVPGAGVLERADVEAMARQVQIWTLDGNENNHG